VVARDQQEKALEAPDSPVGDTLADHPPIGRGQLAYATVLISSVAMFSYLDRSGIAILVEPIKRDLALSDTQVGLLTGIAFSLTYSLFGVPLARIADRGNRVRLLGACLAVWSAATALAGTVTSFIQLIATRVFVGVGDAGGFPASASLLADYYPPETLSRGMSWFLMGGAFGASVGLAFVGVIADDYGWRVAFYAMGIPGVLLAVIVFTTLREPIRGRFQDASAALVTGAIGDGVKTWWQAILEVLRRKTIQHVLIGFAIQAFGAYGVGAWFGAFFMRSHGLSLTEVGAVVAIANGVGAIGGTLLGVLFGPVLIRRDRRWEFWWPAIACLLLVPSYLLAFYLGNIFLVVAALGVAVLIGYSSAGPMLAGIQSVLPVHVRAMGMAMTMLATSLIGAGAGPLLVGALSDALEPRFGADSLRYALMMSMAIFSLGGLHLFLAARHYETDRVS
jgi:MFS family permease